MIKVVIVDDHEMLLEGVALALSAEPDLDIIGTARTRATGLARCRALHPDVVVLDYRIGSESGADLARDLASVDPAITIIGMSAMDSTTVIDELVRAGCMSFVPKQQGIAALASAIRAAHGGVGHLPSRAIRPDPGGDRLSPRELEVLQLMSQGHGPADIARELSLSLHTVRNHIRQIRQKLGVTSQLAAVAVGIRTGLIPGPDTP